MQQPWYASVCEFSFLLTGGGIKPEGKRRTEIILVQYYDRTLLSEGREQTQNSHNYCWCTISMTGTRKQAHRGSARAIITSSHKLSHLFFSPPKHFYHHVNHHQLHLFFKKFLSRLAILSPTATFCLSSHFLTGA